MIFNKHPKFSETHALLSPSQPHWINYDRQRLIDFYDTNGAQEKGTRLHALLAEAITCNRLYGIPNSNAFGVEDTFGMYFHDACEFKMTPEVTLVYSDICYGHADAIAFDEKNRLLRIHDYKSGFRKAEFLQLEVYAAQFFAEYSDTLKFDFELDPYQCFIELRIYQNNECRIETPTSNYILDEVLGRIREKHIWLSEELERRGEQ